MYCRRCCSAVLEAVQLQVDLYCPIRFTTPLFEVIPLVGYPQTCLLPGLLIILRLSSMVEVAAAKVANPRRAKRSTA